MDLLLICSFGVLINALSHETYMAPGCDRFSNMNNVQVRLWDQYDVNGLSEDDRKVFCLARGRSIELILWLSTNFATGITDMPVYLLFSTILGSTCKMICDYKWNADKGRVPCSENFTIKRLKIQIDAAMSCVAEKVDLPPAMLAQLDWDTKKWKFPLSESGVIVPRIPGINIRNSSALPYKWKPQSELFQLGETALDRNFAMRLEVKREIIGMSRHDLLFIFNPHVWFQIMILK